MERKRFTEAQVIGILRMHARREARRPVSVARDRRDDTERLEGALWRHAGLACEGT